MDIARIAQATIEDLTFIKIWQNINQGLTWIQKTEPADAQCFKSILPQLSITGNGIILKDERIVSPKKLQEKAIRIALRYHFFFHDMN
jgi:hypothetical protein